MPETNRSPPVPSDDEEQALIARYVRKSKQPRNTMYTPWETNGEEPEGRQENLCKSL